MQPASGKSPRRRRANSQNFAFMPFKLNGPAAAGKLVLGLLFIGRPGDRFTGVSPGIEAALQVIDFLELQFGELFAGIGCFVLGRSVDDVGVVTIERGKLLGEVFFGGIDVHGIRDVAAGEFLRFSAIEDDRLLIGKEAVELLHGKAFGVRGFGFRCPQPAVAQGGRRE